MAAKKTVKETTRKGKMILPGAAGPRRKHYCPEHKEEMKPVRVFGRKAIMFECKEGCRLSKREAILK